MNTRSLLTTHLFASVVCAVLLSSPVPVAADANGRPSGEGVAYSGTLLVQLRVSDLQRSIEFYRDTLGFEVESHDVRLGFVRIKPGIRGVTLGLSEGETDGSGTLSLNFGVPDLDAARARLEGLGIEFAGPTIEIPGVVRLADLHDPDGHRIRLAGHSP